MTGLWSVSRPGDDWPVVCVRPGLVMTGLWSVSRPTLEMALESLMSHGILDLASVKSI